LAGGGTGAGSKRAYLLRLVKKGVQKIR
jgi:hypothetical protein